MFKKLFFYLLKKYSKTEENRIKILEELDNGVHYNYNEQTEFGNVYNFFIEFIMANKFITKRAQERDENSLNIIRRGIYNEFADAINFIEKEKL